MVCSDMIPAILLFLFNLCPCPPKTAMTKSKFLLACCFMHLESIIIIIIIRKAGIYLCKLMRTSQMRMQCTNVINVLGQGWQTLSVSCANIYTFRVTKYLACQDKKKVLAGNILIACNITFFVHTFLFHFFSCGAAIKSAHSSQIEVSTVQHDLQYGI